MHIKSLSGCGLLGGGVVQLVLVRPREAQLDSLIRPKAAEPFHYFRGEISGWHVRVG